MFIFQKCLVEGGRSSMSFQSMPECEDKGKNLIAAHKSQKVFSQVIEFGV